MHLQSEENFNILINNTPVKYGRYPSGELAFFTDNLPESIKDYADIHANIFNEKDLMLLLLAVNGIKRVWPKCHVSVTLPYLPYSRSDRSHRHEPAQGGLPLALLTGIHGIQVAVYDPHALAGLHAFNSVTVLTLAELVQQSKLYSQFIKKEYSHIIVPDRGARKRGQQIADIYDSLGAPVPKVVFCNKKRLGNKIEMTVPRDKFNRYITNFLYVDDMIDSGETMKQCINSVRKHHPKSIDCLVTNGIFTKGLDILNVFDTVYLKNLHPHIKEIPKKVKVL